MPKDHNRNEKRNYRTFLYYISKILPGFSFIPIIASILAPMFVAFGFFIYLSYYAFLYPWIDIVNYYLFAYSKPLEFFQILLLLEVIIFILGFLIFFSSLLTMVKAKHPPQESIVQNGLYKFIRHPQNLGILLMTLPFTLYIPFFSDIGIRSGDLYSFALFCFFVNLKSLFEERAMVKKFPSHYSLYISNTGSYFPLVFWNHKKKKSKQILNQDAINQEYPILKKIIIQIAGYLLSLSIISFTFFVLLKDYMEKIRFSPPTFFSSVIHLSGVNSFIQFIPLIVLALFMSFVIIKSILNKKWHNNAPKNEQLPKTPNSIENPDDLLSPESNN